MHVYFMRDFVITAECSSRLTAETPPLVACITLLVSEVLD